MMDTIIPFLSAAGLGGVIGSALTSLLQAWLSRKAVLDERRFREKKEAYLNLLNAIHTSEIDGTSDAAKLVGHWKNVSDLVASIAVQRAIERLFETNPLNGDSPHPERPQVLAELKSAMRKDLGIQAR